MDDSADSDSDTQICRLLKRELFSFFRVTLLCFLLFSVENDVIIMITLIE